MLKCSILSVPLLLLVAALKIVAAEPGADSQEKQLLARAKSMVVVTFFVQHETERVNGVDNGIMLDTAGHIVLPGSAVAPWVRADQIKDIRVRALGEDHEGVSASYLGKNFITDWHYIKIDNPEEAQAFTPITAFGRSTPVIGEALWGIGFSGKEMAYKPYFMTAHFSQLQRLPWDVGVCDIPVAAPAGPVFNKQGALVGIAGDPLFKQELIMMNGQALSIGIKSRRRSETMLLVEPFLQYALRIPQSPVGIRHAWMGVTGLLPADKEVMAYHELADQGGVIISDVVKGGPGDKAGIVRRDIVIGMNGKPLPKFLPTSVVSRFFELQILEREPGDSMPITVLRKGKPVDLNVELGTSPKPLNEAEFQYFPRLGFSVREFLVVDGLYRRILDQSSEGVVAKFVKSNSPVASAKLYMGDWIKEIDGKPITSYEQAVQQLQAIENDLQRDYFVMLISRKNETELLRVSLAKAVNKQELPPASSQE